MKKIFYAIAASIALYGCKTTQSTITEEPPIVTNLDLVNVDNDRVMVSVDPPDLSTEETVFYIPKTVPGTYSTSNYGQYAEDFKALDSKGNELEVIKIDENSWRIPNAKKLDKVTYLINDTFDIEGEGGIYSMAGTNILEDENFLLNLHGFVGYFQNMEEKKYRVEILRPSDLIAGSSLNVDETLDSEIANAKTDVYNLNRYFEVTDNPIMYAEPDTTSFMVDNMRVLINVYSPNDKHSAQSMKPAMEKMIKAQKDFLGDINNTDKYAIIVYLSATPGQEDAGNFGALEHHTSTVVVMPETMEQEALNESMTDIVSHEFFHIITPLGVHSNEIHYFDYNNPKMSEHLWMYEGVTEYFANLFQVNQGLIDNQDFYDRINEKINTAKRFDDNMSFTVMSENILEDAYKDSYYNVYQKGALIGMALDIRLRELSDGQMGILDLMKKLTERYGKNKPFEDEELIPAIVELTYPEIQEFFDTYVSGTTPIPYDSFFEKVGLELREDQVPVDYLLKDQSTPYITVNASGSILVRNDIELNTFFTDLGLQGGDVIREINSVAYTRENIYDLVMASQNWNEGDQIEVKITRNGEDMVLEGPMVAAKAPGMRLTEIPSAGSQQIELRHTWLKS
ncbi:peptidase M61 [Autumnicola musiva]|uniref:Peptidase M61 n=1 Tax=Autumnicola musiva TaxID=3075589 RepID=A0ABU3D7T3_9FLAO|nr:peptidase M61 [Zunongwangia sp. F117]MDT0677496.1 peptidase M61 [Zunongwangia sp. F117]